MVIAVNKQTGEYITLENDQWVPAKTARNPKTGERIVLDDGEWRPMNSAAKRPEQQEGIGRTAFDQALQGATFGFADEISDRIGAGIASATIDDLTYDDALKMAREESQARLARQQKQNPGTALGANIAGSLLTGGAGASTSAAKAIGAGANTIGKKIALGAAAGAAGGAASGAGTAEEGQRADSAKAGALFGGAVGGAIPAVVPALKSTVLPRIGKEVATLAKRAQQLGIDLRIDQISPTRARSAMQKISQDIPFSGVDAAEEVQRKNFTRAVARTIGIDSDTLDAESINQFLKTSSTKFEDALGGDPVNIDRKTGISLLRNMKTVLAESKESAVSDISELVAKNIDIIKNEIGLNNLSKGVVMNPRKLASLRSRMMNNSSRASGEAKHYLGGLVSAIDDSIEKVIPPQRVAQLKTARREYRNFKTIEGLLLDEGADGTINPTKLLQKIKSSKFIKGYTSKVGEDDLVDLGRIGKKFLVKKGGSDTQTKAAFLGAGAGATIGPLLALASGGGVAVANRGLQKLNSSPSLVRKAVEGGLRQGNYVPSTNILSLLAGSQAGSN